MFGIVPCPNQWRDFDDLYIIWYVSAQGSAYWRLCWYWSPFRKSNAPKPHFGGVNRRFQAKCAKYINSRVIKTTAAILTKSCTVIKTSKYSLWASQNVPHKSKMADGRDPAILKKTKNCYMSGTVWLILTIYTSYHVFPCKDVSFRGLIDTAPIYGSNAPKTPILGHE